MAATSNKEARDRSRSPVQTIKVCIHDLSGSFLCEVSSPKNELVDELCQEIQDLEGTEIPLQKLFFDGRALDINRRLTTYGIQESADITLIRLQKPPGCYSCFNRRCHERHWHSWFCTTCKQARYCLKETFHVPEDPDELHSNNICEECFNTRKPLR